MQLQRLAVAPPRLRLEAVGLPFEPSLDPSSERPTLCRGHPSVVDGVFRPLYCRQRCPTVEARHSAVDPHADLVKTTLAISGGHLALNRRRLDLLRRVGPAASLRSPDYLGLCFVRRLAIEPSSLAAHPSAMPPTTV